MGGDSNSVSGDETLFRYTLISFLIAGPTTTLSLRYFQAPYGKHNRPGWGPSILSPLAWLLMESPTLFITALLIPTGKHSSNLRCLFLLSPFLLHYLHRTIINPLRIAAAPDRKKFPVLVAAVGFVYNILNTYVQIRFLSEYKDYDLNGQFFWVRGLAGLAVFLAGIWVNVWSDQRLVELKREASGGYVVPSGGLFEFVCAPNYFVEIFEWFGWAVMSWSLAGVGFLVFSCCNLVPRAHATRRWYREKFGEDFPKERKAVIPFLY